MHRLLGKDPLDAPVGPLAEHLQVSQRKERADGDLLLSLLGSDFGEVEQLWWQHLKTGTFLPSFGPRLHQVLQRSGWQLLDERFMSQAPISRHALATRAMLGGFPDLSMGICVQRALQETLQPALQVSFRTQGPKTLGRLWPGFVEMVRGPSGSKPEPFFCAESNFQVLEAASPLTFVRPPNPKKGEDINEGFLNFHALIGKPF
ncbi:MAG: hypothetical protein WC777_02810 [Candidatus Gracilibacteria bacterium]